MNLGTQTSQAPAPRQWTSGRIMTGFGASVTPPLSSNAPRRAARPSSLMVQAFGNGHVWDTTEDVPTFVGHTAFDDTIDGKTPINAAPVEAFGIAQTFEQATDSFMRAVRLPMSDIRAKNWAATRTNIQRFLSLYGRFLPRRKVDFLRLRIKEIDRELVHPTYTPWPGSPRRPTGVAGYGGFWDWATALVMPAPLGLAMSAVNLGSDDGWMNIAEEAIGGTGYEEATSGGTRPKGFFASAGEGVGKGAEAFGAGIGKGVGTAIAVVAVGVVAYLVWKAPNLKRA